MEYLIVSFRSRAHTVRFYEFLRKNGIFSEIVNTPKEAGVGCGLSVKTAKAAFGAVKKAVRILSLNSFAGFFIVSASGGIKTIRSI